MENTIVQLSKYVITFLMICFTVQSFAALKERDEDERHYILMRQIIMIILMNFICFFVMFLQEGEVSTIQMFLLTMAYILGVQILYRLIYRKASMILVNNMCMLLSISMIILTRLSVSKAMSQYKILAASTLLCFIIPVIVRKGKFLKNLTWIYAVLGIAMLSVVMVLGFTSGGAKLSIEIHGITFQLSEIAKITLVFFMAGMLREDNSFGNVVKATVIAAVHVLILVASTDLGTAFVFFMAYVVVIYVATRKARYPLLGLAGMSAACVVAYFLFSHVRNRVALWQDPIGNWDISSQLAQGLFGMCSGGWFGTGLFEGRPDIIPVATKDFIFCAICEEMGIIFGICLILLCMSTFLLIINISMKMSKRFYKLIAMGLGTEYATQVFLTIGGTIKFIPMTGITLPLVSYGGSSMFSTVLMLAVPARVAGCGEVILCTPARPDGTIAPEILYAADLCGVDRIFSVGGAQAVAAMAYGTESIPRVDKIFGPGNRYVTKAKQLVGANDVAVDLPAGPSEVLVLADDEASPAFAAADLLSQAEHGGDSQAVLVCPSVEFARDTQRAVGEQLLQLRRGETIREALRQSRIVVLDSREKMIGFANAYAPEHLIISMRDAWDVAAQITAAGSVFIGPWSPESAGDYASGTNHTLPTGGWARAYSGVNTDSFLRKITYQELSRKGLAALSPTVIAMAEAEGLGAHAAAVRVRMKGGVL